MSSIDLELARAVISRSGWLASFDRALPEAFIGAGRLVRFQPGQWTHAEGDRETGLIFVIEGAVQLFTAAPGDREVLVGHAEQGSAFGQTVRFGGGPRLVSAICVTPCLLLIVSDSALTRLAARWPDIWRAVAGLAYAQLRASVRGVAELLALPPRQRLAARLVSLATPKHGTPPIPLAISQQTLGELIGLTRKTVNGLLSALAREDLVRVGYGRLEILSLKGLERVANS